MPGRPNPPVCLGWAGIRNWKQQQVLSQTSVLSSRPVSGHATSSSTAACPCHILPPWPPILACHLHYLLQQAGDTWAPQPTGIPFIPAQEKQHAWQSEEILYLNDTGAFEKKIQNSSLIPPVHVLSTSCMIHKQHKRAPVSFFLGSVIIEG